MLDKLSSLCFLLLLSQLLIAQDVNIDFSDEKAVISNFEEQLIISYSKAGKLEATTTVVQQTKLQKSEGLGLLADKDIYHSFFSELGNLNAYTIKAGTKNKKIPILKKETKSDRSSYVFYEDGKVTTLYYGGLELGASTYLQYDKHHKDINILPSKFVQYSMPIKKFMYQVVTPAELNIRFAKRFYGSNNIKYSVRHKKNKTIHTFKGADIPAYDPPEYAPSIKHYMPHIIPIIEDYVDPIKRKKIVVHRTVDDLYNYYQSYMTQANMTPDPSLKKMSMDIVGDRRTDKEKAMAIFNWVKAKIKYVAFEDGYGGFVPRLAKDVCSKRYGDCKDMSTLLVHLLRSQNLKAYHTWVGTRSIPYSYTEVPTTASDNHMICALDLDGTWFVLDATSSFIPFGYVPDNLQGKEALIGINKDSFIIKKLPIAPASQNTIADTTWMEIKNKRLQGNIHLVVKGYKAIEMKTYLSYKDTDDKEDYIKRFLYRGNNKCLLDHVKWSFPSEESMDIVATFKLDNYLQEVSGDIYLNTLLTKFFSGYRIKEEKRTAKVDNQWATQVSYISYLKLPVGYKVHYKPENINLSVNQHYTADIRFKERTGGVLESKLNVSYDVVDIEPKQLKDHNELVSRLEETYKEVVHLKK